MQCRVLVDNLAWLGTKYNKGDIIEVTERAFLILGSNRLEVADVKIEGIEPEAQPVPKNEDEALANGASNRKRRARNSTKS